MEKQLIYTLDLLTKNSVSVKKETYIDLEGQTYLLERTRTAYANSNLGRQQVKTDLPEEYATAIFAVWGSEPTVEDPEPPVVIE